MDGVARLEHGERELLFQQVAAKRGLLDTVIEKDFWVCWCLKCLFNLPDGHPPLLFKGGTSLSKAYGLISRFSEDIDLSLDRHALGFEGEKDPLNAPSRGEARRLIGQLAEACEGFIAQELLPRLQETFREIIAEESKTGWSLRVSEEDAQTLLFSYPSGSQTVDREPAYLAPVIRMELGARSDHWPVLNNPVQPYAAEDFPDYFEEDQCNVRTLAPERTFWEKATILHMEWHRRMPKPVRLSRHYYDLVMLRRSEVHETALEQIDLLEKVAAHKEAFYYAAWARYDEARVGSLRLVPHDDLAEALRRDHEDMREMFFEEPPTFEEIMGELEALEHEINSA